MAWGQFQVAKDITRNGGARERDGDGEKEIESEREREKERESNYMISGYKTCKCGSNCDVG